MFATFYYINEEYLEIPVSLLCRLVLTSDAMVEQFASVACADSKVDLILFICYVFVAREETYLPLYNCLLVLTA